MAEVEEEKHMNMIRKLSSSAMEESVSVSGSMPSATVGRAMSSLLTARPKKLQHAISSIDSPPKFAPLGVSLEQSLCVLQKYVRDAVEKEESLDQVFIPMLHHSLKHKELKHGNQPLVLLNWLFQDDIHFEALSVNLASCLLRKEDHYVSLGWCILARSLVEYEITMEKLPTKGISENYPALLKILSSCVKYLVSMVQGGSVLQGGYELPTRLSIAAVDFVLALTVALTRKDLDFDASNVRPRSSSTNSSGRSVAWIHSSSSKKEIKVTSKSSAVSRNMEMQFLLWNHLDEIIILVDRLIAWSRKSMSLHAKGLEKVLLWLRGLNQQYGCFEIEEGSKMRKTGVLLLSSCWKHYGKLLHLEDSKCTQQFTESLEQYMSGIQFYADKNSGEHNANDDSGIETTKFFLNCLCLLLGRFGGKQFECAMTEYGPQMSRILISLLHCANEDVIDGAVSLLRAAIFKSNHSLAASNVTDSGDMDVVIPSLLHFLDERDVASKAVVMLIAEYCSITSDDRCLQEVLGRLISGNISQRRNAADVISKLVHMSLDTVNTLSSQSWQYIANYLLECLKDEESVIQAQASSLIPMMDPSLILPSVIDLIYSSDERIHSSAGNSFIALLKYRNHQPEVICMLLDCLSKQLTSHDCPPDRKGSKQDPDAVLKLIPEWSNFVKDWNLLIGPLIDKMFAEPSNSVIVKFLSYISEHLADNADNVFCRLLMHTKGQKEMDESSFSSWDGRTYRNDDAGEMQNSLFDRLCPLLIIKLLPLRIFDDLNSSLIYGAFNQHVEQGHSYVNVSATECVVGLLMSRALSKFEFEDVRKLAAELCGRIHPHVLMPIMSSQLENAASSQDVLKIKACLFSICTSLVVRGGDSISHSMTSGIRKSIESILLWPSTDGDEVFKAQHGCIDCLALMLCAEVQALETEKTSNFGNNSFAVDAGSIYSVHSWVISQLMGVTQCRPDAVVPLPFRLCMANVIISACQKISDSGKKAFARKILPRVIHSMALVDSEVRAACIQVLFSAVYHLKSAIIPYSSEFLKVSLKSLREGSPKERMAGAKLLASLMGSEEAVVKKISGGLLEARELLSIVSSSDPSPDIRQLCQKLLVCITLP